MHQLDISFKSFLQIVREFIRALSQKRTYSFIRNWYCFFGVLWGLPVPVVTIWIDLYSSGLEPTLSNINHLLTSHPFHLFFLLHPLFFGIVFGAMGTVRYNKEQSIQEFEKNLMNKNTELENANKKLKELDKLKVSFLSMVSHELRTPLTTIQGYITFLQNEKSGALNEAQKECLKTSEEEADLLNHLIEDLLDLSKIETGAFKINPGRVEISEVINKAVSSLQLSADTKGITLKNNLPSDLPPVSADKERILQVVANLIENALKFNKRGGSVYITASRGAQNDKVIFCVSDTGIGIPRDKLDKIFDKFYQVDSSSRRRYEGCGLGLAISESIIKLHNGRIWVESEMGVGSKFFFELPIFETRKEVSRRT